MEKETAAASDEKLVRKYQAGDAEAADRLIERYKQLVRARARTLFLTGGDRDDLLQEGMIGLFRAIRSYDPEREGGASFRNYAALCIDRQMYSAILAAQRRKNRPLNDSVSLDAFAAGVLDERLGTSESPETLLLGEETVSQLRAEIASLLSPYETRVLELYLEGRGYIEIAALLGKSPKSVDNALNRMKQKVSAHFGRK